MSWGSPGPYVQAAYGHPARPRGVLGVGIGMIIAGSLNFVCGAVWMATGLSQVHNDGIAGTSDAVADAVAFSPILSVFVSPATIIGGIQLLRRATRNLAMVGAIAAIVPLTSCCFLAGVPVGIWAVVVLRRPETHAWYAGTPAGPTGYDIQPPAPYQGWP